MSIVTQEPILFNDTIANNIAPPASPMLSMKKLIQAAKIANAHNFIIQKEEGYDTNIGDRAVNSVAAKRQKRLRLPGPYWKTTILILDEATSSLDTERKKVSAGCAINNMDAKPHSAFILHTG